jgi:hypothetical protein
MLPEKRSADNEIFLKVSMNFGLLTNFQEGEKRFAFYFFVWILRGEQGRVVSKRDSNRHRK